MLKINLKNNKGVTLFALTVMVIIMLLLSSVTLVTELSVMTDIRAGRLIANMDLVQAKVDAIADDYAFNQDDSILINASDGTDTYKIDESTGKLQDIELSNEEIDLMAENAENDDDVYEWTWYRWDVEALKKQGLNKEMLGDSSYFYVNYENSEIISSSGVKEDGIKYYSLTGLKHIYEN